jgi:hypothetical protein
MHSCTLSLVPALTHSPLQDVSGGLQCHDQQEAGVDVRHLLGLVLIKPLADYPGVQNECYTAEAAVLSERDSSIDQGSGATSLESERESMRILIT